MASTKDYTGQTFVPGNKHDTYPFINPQNHNLEGKSVFISGASKGIGKAIALSFAVAGVSKIAIAARTDLHDLVADIENAAQKAGRTKPHVLNLKLDVISWTSVAAVAKEVESQYGSVDILVNNAGYLSEFTKMADIDIDDYWQSFEVNVKSICYMEKAFIPLLKNSMLKTIINMSSIGATIVSPGASSYQTSKLAVARLTEFTAVEYADSGIIAFSLHPGGVRTDMGLKMPQQMHAYLTDTPELSADTVVWLASERREWLNGRYLSANWDMEALLEAKSTISANEDLLKFKLLV